MLIREHARSGTLILDVRPQWRDRLASPAAALLLLLLFYVALLAAALDGPPLP